MTSQKENTAQPRIPDCYRSGSPYRVFVEFQLSPGAAHGFAMAQILDYFLETLPPTADPEAPTERLTIYFSTADVVVLGKRLSQLTSLIVDHKLAEVRAVSSRYADLIPDKAWVGSIQINRVEK